MGLSQISRSARKHFLCYQVPEDASCEKCGTMAVLICQQLGGTFFWHAQRLTLRAFASIPRGNMLNGVAELERLLPLRCMAENTRKRCAICLPSDIPSVLLRSSGFTVRNIAGNKQRLYRIILVSFPRFTARKRGICPQCKAGQTAGNTAIVLFF